MAYTLTIKGYENPVLASLMQAARRQCSSEVLNRFVGQAVRDGVRVDGEDVKGLRQHIIDEAPNHHETAKRLGAEPTNFYAKAASGIQLIATGREAQVIIVNGAPIFARVSSDVIITPKDGKQWLTIAAKAATYGHRAGEFSNLEFINLTKAGGEPLGALVIKKQVSRGVLKASVRKAARAAKAATASKPTQAATAESAEEETSKAGDLDIMFWCKKKIILKQDPRLLPSREQIIKLARGGMYRAVTLALHKFNDGLLT